MPRASEPDSETSPLSYPAPPAERRTWKTRLLLVFTWWTGATVNTRVWTSRFGELVGHDEFGNAYYRTAGRKIDVALGFERRWVIYRGESEGSATPPGWYGWLHHQTDEAPPQSDYVPRGWEKPYLPNMTGTPAAYRPQGSLLKDGTRPRTGGDYDAWTPG